MRLSETQLKALRMYEHAGVTTQVFCSLATFRCLVRAGYLIRSYGPGAIEAEITATGRAALKEPT